MKSRNNLFAGLLIAAGMGVLASPAMAQKGDCAPMGNWENFHEQRNERMQQHQKRLHAALKLSPEQETGWNKFVASLQTSPKNERPGATDWHKLTAPERAEKTLEFSKRRQDRLADHVAALKTFYASLTPEQQKVFDDHHPGPREARRGRGPLHSDGAPAANG